MESDGQAVRGIDATADRPAAPTITFRSIGPLGWVDAFDGCTRLSTWYRLVDDRLTVRFGNRLAMGCGTFGEDMPDPFEALERTATVDAQDGVLLLKDSHGVVIMRLTPDQG